MTTKTAGSNIRFRVFLLAMLALPVLAWGGTKPEEQTPPSTQNTWIRRTPLIPEQQQSFMQAVKLGNIERVRFHLNHGVAADDKQDGKYTGLFAASAKNRLAIAELLLQHGANVNAQGPGGWSPLMIAAFHGHASLLTLLVKHGAKLELQNYEGKTALMFAVENAQPDAAQQLIKAGANVNARVHGDTGKGESVLTLAIAQQQRECIDLLLKSGADVKITQPVAAAPLVQAALHNDTTTLGKLIGSGAKLKASYGQGNRLLHLIVPFARAETLEFLLAHGADPADANLAGKSAFIMAAESGNAEAINVFLKAVDAKQKDAALLAATEKGLKNIVELLSRNGAHLNAQNSEGQTALMLAARGRHAKLVTYLLSSGADPLREDAAGRNALMYAVTTALPRADIVKQLITAGSGISHRDNNGNTALQLALASPTKPGREITGLLESRSTGK